MSIARAASNDLEGSNSKEAVMTKIVTRSLALATLSVMALLSPASARAPSGPPASARDLATDTARCRQEVSRIYHNDGGIDRTREFAFDACMTNGGEMPR
jgi:hypothetical protein